MSMEDILKISFIFVAIFILIYKLVIVYDKKIKATDKALLELYDRITELESKLNNN